MFQDSFKGASRKFKGCFKGVLRVLRMIQGSFKKTFKVFHKKFHVAWHSSQLLEQKEGMFSHLEYMHAFALV